MADTFKTNATIASFGGKLLKLEHDSLETGCSMKLNLYLPAATEKGKVPVIFYLAGLTCTGDNGAEKGFFQKTASEKGIAIVYPDTSPRGLGIKGEDEDWDFGTGAGFYVDATKPPYSEGYKMYSYITSELPRLLYNEFPLDSHRVSIMGHSMGGHGALTLFLKNPKLYKSVSAFAPISNPKNCAWGKKAFKGYLHNEDEWDKWDATELVKGFKGERAFQALIDIGDGDNFYKQGQLLPENFVEAAKSKGYNDVELRIQPGYDHSYFFISTFAEDHINYHAKHLL